MSMTLLDKPLFSLTGHEFLELLGNTKPEVVKQKNLLRGADRLAEKLQVSRPTIFKWIKTGKITCNKQGKILLFDYDKVLEELQR